MTVEAEKAKSACDYELYNIINMDKTFQKRKNLPHTHYTHIHTRNIYTHINAHYTCTYMYIYTHAHIHVHLHTHIHDTQIHVRNTQILCMYANFVQ